MAHQVGSSLPTSLWPEKRNKLALPLCPLPLPPSPPLPQGDSSICTLPGLANPSLFAVTMLQLLGSDSPLLLLLFFFFWVCVWAATFSPVSSAVWGLRTSVKKLCAALFPVCERGVGGSSKPTERRDENKIKWKKKLNHILFSHVSGLYLYTETCLTPFIFSSLSRDVCLCTGFISLHSIPILITLFFTPPCFVSKWRDGGEDRRGEEGRRGGK